jgi:hypothetical protein
MSSFDRRYFLGGSAALGGAMLAGGAPLHRSAEAAPVHIEAPVVDRVVVQEITDGAHDIFLRGAELPGLSVQGPAAFAPQGRTLSSEWGLALHIQSHKGGETRQVMAELKKFDLEHVLTMHCSGQNFIDLAKQEMPEKLVLCTTGSRFTFTA